MFGQVVTENGQKKIIPLTADAGAGGPVGSYIYMEKKSAPAGYLYCDGSTFDQAAYPLLYAYLGSNVLPDWREFAAVGAEENTTDVYDANDNPTGTIHNHDVFTQGQAKDDCLQDHRHKSNVSGSGNTGITRGTVGAETAYTGTAYNGRISEVTRGKRRAVFIYIKATSGISENAQDNVVAQLNEERSYSTEEVNTGKKWIDGKPIYRKVVDYGALPASSSKSVAHNISNLDVITKLSGITRDSTPQFMPLPHCYPSNNALNIGLLANNTNVTIVVGTDRSAYTYTKVILEYTKTTD